MASDWGFHSGLSFNGPIWSISVEVLAYAVFFLLARRCRFTSWRLMGIIVGLIAAKMVLPWVKDIVLCQLYFFVGGAVYLLSSRRTVRLGRETLVSVALAVSVLAGNWVTNGKLHTFAVIAVAVALIFMFLVLGVIPFLRAAGAGMDSRQTGSAPLSAGIGRSRRIEAGWGDIKVLPCPGLVTPISPIDCVDCPYG